MSKRQVLITIGLWIIIFLFLGFPSRWEKILAILTGLLIMVIAYRIRSPKRAEPSDTYVEHRTSREEEHITKPDSSVTS